MSNVLSKKRGMDGPCMVRGFAHKFVSSHNIKKLSYVAIAINRVWK
jgi:hypothetical protein